MRRATPIAFVLLLAASASAQPAPAPTARASAPAPAPEPAPPPAGSAPGAAPTASPPGTPAPAPPPTGSAPPGYYVEGQSPPPAAPGGPPPPPAGTFEPPPPGYGPIFEPPPPPVARHVAPRTALWAGVRLGWFLPFGYVYAQNLGSPFGEFDRIPWSDYASSGLMIEGDIGARLGRNYTVFALWERAQLGSGDSEQFGEQDGGDSDFWAIGLQASSDADDLGFLTEIALGYRQARATWNDGTEYQFTGAILEGRLGFGADIRLDKTFSIAPMLTIGVGSFGDVDVVYPDGRGASVVRAGDAADSHAWMTLGVGAHADLFGTK